MCISVKRAVASSQTKNFINLIFIFQYFHFTYKKVILLILSEV